MRSVDPHASRFVRGCRALGATMLAAILWLFVGAAFTPLPPALRAGGGYGASVQFLDREGELLREVRADDSARAVWVPLDEVGDGVIRAVLAAEDRRFDEHVGVDPAATVRAVATSLRARRVVSGASTITMQLARLVEPHPRTFRGKLGEAAMAVRIEASLSKRQILEQYLNRAPFGDGVRGIGAASRYFFDKPPRELSTAEAATLAGIPRGPSWYSLVRRPDRVLVRRDRVLDRMLAGGAIGREEHARARAEPLTLQIGKGGFGAPHLVDALLAGSLDRSVPALRGKTARVETTVDRGLQREVESAARDVLRPLASRHVTAASVLVVDNATGDVLAYVGSPRWEDDAHGGKNDGVRAKRQPGSTLKPFVYGLAMEDLGWTPATLLPDVELHLATPGGTYSPRNYDERFHGPVRLREALASSYNVPAVFAANEVGVGRVLDRLRDVGFTTLGESAEFYGPALALGDGEVRLYDLVGAYAAIARGGVHRPLRAVRAAGDVALSPIVEGRRVMPEAEAAMLADVLRDRAARVAAFGEHTALDLPFAVAAKTGTSKGYRDNWTVGFTREVTVGVWVGNFDGSAMIKVSGITGAAPLFAAAMSAAMRRVTAEPAHEHAPVAGVTRARVCALSGGAPGHGCTHVVDELVPRSALLAPCAMHETVKIDVRNGLLATPSCPARFVAERTFERFDGPFASWAHAIGREGAPSEASPLCGSARGGERVAGGRGAPAIRYPRDGARFLVDPDRPRSAQAIPLKVDAPAASDVAVFVDGRLAGRGAAGAPVYWALERGEHAIVAEAGGRRSEVVGIVVE
ncbi:MAG: penicillin-binding protein 1C [Labilithrix sp.]|nr:penicillin-binding protein 1C [Labilithrix sp.]